jgi:hypothetical protein
MTTNKQLEEMAHKLAIPHFRGVYMCDQLQSLKPLEKESGVCNFQSTKQQGSHWVAWYKDGSRKSYFDSYGADILPELKAYLGSPIKCHNFQIQEFNSDVCGELCLLFIYLMNKGIPYEDFILSMLDASV